MDLLVELELLGNIIVEFGKYKNQPLKQLEFDDGYKKWFLRNISPDMKIYKQLVQFIDLKSKVDNM